MIKEQCIGFLNTPPLWQNNQYEIQQFDFPKMSLQGFQPNPIPQNIRLGHQMEYVFKQLVAYSGAYDILLYNLPIRQGQRTIGEIDFILKDKTNNKFIHIELTYKFYIINPEIPETYHSLTGPNKKDSFIAKIKKIKNVQFPLLHSEAASQALNEINIDHLGIEHQCCFKAQLFKAYGSKMVDFGVLNKNCLMGYWMKFEDFNQSEFKQYEFYIPNKSEWVIAPNDQVEWRSHFEILTDIQPFLNSEKSPLVWLKKPKGDLEKIFIVWW